MLKLRKRPPPTASLAEQKRKHRKNIAKLLQKSRESLNESELKLLESSADTIKIINQSKRSKQLSISRQNIVVDDEELLTEKVDQLAALIRNSNCCLFYTGAGISTSCGLPDFRSREWGAWTNTDSVKEYLSNSERSPFAMMRPAASHMCIQALVSQGLIQHVVSQNCDGLHLRSGIPPQRLSEIHGNMFAEACTECQPQCVFYRRFDVTESTSFRKHFTSRVCPECNSRLRDTVVHRDEYNTTDYPQNWVTIDPLAQKADLVVCMGSRMDIIKCYKRLWRSPGVEKKRLVIINLGWTTKDKICRLKINGDCDEVMNMLCNKLNIKPVEYNKENDLLLQIADRTLKGFNGGSGEPKTPDIYNEDEISNSKGYIPGWMRVILNRVHNSKK
ncbi:NAD-dependent protein deacetylase sirtuin-7-like [Convolutriloba macropyga]|uniref:NAD-dependent protein deacetylase sirtuin-7-like n=1 Tax=Convolutriloba macropyga TaxID=536237 RepID=UPI003F51F1D8